ncbi:hypothetical protein ATX91_09570 [Oenococcus oeni]|nr:hypothetical protein ATX91_09570 [Oenococcus oeni]
MHGNSSISVLSDGGSWTTLLIVGLGKMMTWTGISLIGIAVLAIMIWQNKFRKPKIKKNV